MSDDAKRLALQAVSRLQRDQTEVPERETPVMGVPAPRKLIGNAFVPIACGACRSAGKVRLGSRKLPEGWAMVPLSTSEVPVCSDVCAHRLKKNGSR